MQNFTISDFASFARSMNKCFALLVLGQKARVRSPRGLRGTTAEAYNWNNDTFFGQGGSTATSIDDDADNTWGGRAGPAIRTAPPVHTLHSPTFYDRIKALVPLFLAGGSSENPLDCIIFDSL